MSEISHKKIKILFPALHYPPVIGGIERWTCEVAERLAQKAEVFVITGKVNGESKEGIKNGARIIRTGLFSLKNLSHSPSFYILSLLPFFYYKASRLIKERRIDLLHCTGFLSGVVGYYLKKKYGIPYIITVQSLQENKPLQKLKTKVYQNADHCIAASLAISKYFEKMDIEPAKISIIPNGINLNNFLNINKGKKRKELGFREEDFVVVVVARLEKVKGIEYLIKAMKNFQLLIIGDGSERANLENLVSELGFEDRVIFLGALLNEQLPEYLSVGDCFCLPSLEEGFGIVVLEAMAAGLPVVATKVGGLRDLIQDGKTGIFIPPKDPLAIERAMQRLYEHRILGQELAENAKIGLEEYDWDNIAEKVWLLSQKSIF